MQTPDKYRRQRGFTLAEIMVAIAIFAVIFVATLMIYDQSNKDFKGGVERADLQQNVRVAYEKLVADIRMAGFDYDRDGYPSGAGSAAWQPNRSYSVDNVVSPITANGFTYVAIAAGMSGGAEPTWNTTIGGTTNDGPGGLRWRTEPGINQYQQPDEQIEYAHARALTIRSNFDFESDSEEGNGREPDLETPQFPVITTGNDEIVTYALRSVRGPNPDSIEFYVDMQRRAHPGGIAEQLVRIPNVDLCTTGTCTSPPYTLFRFTFDAAGRVVEAPVATNIRELAFTYYGDTVGTGTPFQFNPALANTSGSSGGGQFNPNLQAAGAEARARRAEIKSVRVKLTGMNSTKDSRYFNPEEVAASPARNYRTYSLQSLIVPRNLGKMGVRELQDAPPGEPVLRSLCSGWCGGVKLSWVAPTPSGETGDVDQYVIIYDTVRPPVRFQRQVGPVTSAFVDDLDPTQTYYFTVAAVNSFGTTTAKTTSGDVEYLPLASGFSVKNKTTPEPPSNLVASGGSAAGSPASQENRITLTWNNPINNLAPQNQAECILLAGGSETETAPIAPGELLRYDILRSEDPNFDPDDEDEYELVTDAAPNRIIIAPSSTTFEDASAVACKRYYYRIRMVERCNPPTGSNNVNPAKPVSDYFPPEGTAAIEGYARASSPPATPAALIHPLAPAPASSCGVDCTIYMQWPKVTTDSTGRNVAVEDYVVTRKQLKNGTVIREDEIEVEDTTPGVGQYVTFGASDTPYWTDSGAHLPSVDTADDVAYRYAYTVRARFECDPLLESAESPELRFPCPYSGGAVDIDMGGIVDGTGTSLAAAWVTDAGGVAELTVTPDNPATVTSVQVLLASISSNAVLNLGTGVTPPYRFPIEDTEAGEIYRIYVIVKDTEGCQQIDVRYLEAGTPSGCCLAAYADDPLIMQYTQGSSFIDVFLDNLCDNDLVVQPNGIELVWNTAGLTPGTRLVSVSFPGETGGSVTTTLNNANGTPGAFSLPAGARNPIRSGDRLRVQLQFDRPLVTATSPLTSFCAKYQRNGIDLATQNCRIVPQPSDPAATSCN